MTARTQCEHEAINAKEYPGTRQLCSVCDEPTGRCEEDSFYTEDGKGPMCENCFKDDEQKRDNMVGLNAFSLKSCGAGSDKYGVCECCKGNVDSTYRLTKYKTYFSGRLNRHSLTDLGDVFGHKNCLSALAI